MPKQNKFSYLNVVQGNYAGYWEDLDESEDRREMIRSLGEYTFATPNHAHRIIKRRVLN